MAYSSKFTKSVLNGTYKPSFENKTTSTKKYTSKFVDQVLSGTYNTNSVIDFAKQHNIELPTFDKPSSLRDGAGVVNADGYTYTGKNYGDYWYENYAKDKDNKIYEKNGIYYVYNERRGTYENVDTIRFMTTKEQSKKDYAEAKKLGYKGNKSALAHISDQIKLDTAGLTSKEKEEYEQDLLRQQRDRDEALARKYAVHESGTGLKGAWGETKNIIGNVFEKIDDDVIEPIGTALESYNYGKKTEELGKEYYKMLMGEDNNVAQLEAELGKYAMFNQDIVNSNNVITQSIQSAPTQLGGLIEGVKGGGILGTIGAVGGATVGAITTKSPQGAIAGATTGGKWLGGAGYVAGQSQYTYELETGLQYKALLEMGVPEDIAKEEAKNVGTINALIESGESILDVITLGRSSKLTEALKNRLVKKYGAEIVAEWSKNIVLSQVKNVASESFEEGLQEKTAIESEKRAAKKAGIVRDDSEDWNRIKQSVITAAFSSLVTAGGTKVVSTGVNKTLTNEKITSAVKEQISKIEEARNIKLTEKQKAKMQQEAVENVKDNLETVSSVDEVKDIDYYKTKRTNAVEGLKKVNPNDTKKVNQYMDVIDAIDNEIARLQKIEDVKTGKDIESKVEEKKTEKVAETNVGEKKTETKVKEKKTETKVEEKKVETPTMKEEVKPTNEEIKESFANYTKNKKEITQQDINNFHKDVQKEVTLKELKDLLLPKEEPKKVEVAKKKTDDEVVAEKKVEAVEKEAPIIKKEVPAEITAMYDKLSPRDKVVADKLIELREAYKENPNDKKLASQLKEYNGMASKEVKQYLFERNKAMIDFKKVDKEVVEQQTQKAFEEPPIYRDELSSDDTAESNVSDLDSMSKNDLFDYAKQQYESYLQSDIPSIREKALKYYKAYKDDGGKKNIATLDEYLNDIEEDTSVVEEEPVVEEPKTLEEYHKSRPNSTLEDSYGGKKMVVEYSIKPVDNFNGKLRGDVTLDELNNSMVKLIMYNEDGTYNEYTYANKKELFDDIKHSFGGWKQLGDGPKTIMSTQGDFYLERDKFIKGGWKWVDANDDLIKGQESADIGQRHRKMMEKLRAEVEKTGEVPEVTADDIIETPIENPNIAEEVEDDVLEARIVGGELISSDKQLSRFAEKFKAEVREEQLLSEEDIAEIDRMYLYEVAHNKASMDRAKTTVKEQGFEKTKETFIFNSQEGDLSLKNYAIGHELLQEALSNNDTKSINEILPYLTIQGTEAGQIIQLTKLYHRLNGEQLLFTLQKKIDIMKKNKVKGSENMVLTNAMIDKILKAGDDRVALKEAMGEIEYELGTKLKGDAADKINAIRFYSMLDNVTTHVNNITNNGINGIAYKGVKDIIGAVIESGVRKWAPDTFKNTVRSENEAYVTIQDKQRLQESRDTIKKLDKAIESNNYSDSIELRKQKEKVINKLKGQVKMDAIHDEVNSIWKEINSLREAKNSASEIRIEDGQQSDELISMQNKEHELIKIKDRLESKLPKTYSTKTLHKASDDLKELTEIYLERNKDALKNRSKTNSSFELESMKSIFGKNAIDPQVEEMIERGEFKKAAKRVYENLKPTGDKNKVIQFIANAFETKMKFNSFMLNFEDLLFKNFAFKKSFANAAMANGLDAKVQAIKNSPEYQNLADDAKADYIYSKICKENADMLADIYDYSVNEAFEATAQQENLLARVVDHFKRIKNDKNAQFVEKVISLAIDAQNPFTRTLFNTAENAFMYSPNSLITTTIDGFMKARKGEFNASKFINDISKGLTGTAVRMVGYVLSSWGVLTEEDDEEPYGIRFGDIVISIDKFDMLSINLFAGARLRELSTKEDVDGEDAVWSYVKPFVDMTFLSTYTDTMTDFKYGGPVGMVGDMFINFTMQHIPHGGSKLNKIIDTKERAIYPDSDESYRYPKQLINQILSRVPLGYNFLPEKMNEWGETQERNGSIIVRAFDELIWPGKIIQGTENSIPELTALQKATGESGLAPSKFDGTIEYKKQKFEATVEEKRVYQKTYGNNALEAITEFTNSSEYKNLTDKQRVKAINTIYEGARELAKQEFFDNRNEDYETSAAWINEISGKGISIAEYATFKSKIDDANSDVKFSSTAKAIKRYNGSNAQKAYLYGKVYSNTEETNTVIVNSGISFDAYLDYKGRTRNLKADPDSNSKIEGATISGSKKKKVLTEIAKTKGLSKEQKLLLTYLAGFSINNGDYNGVSKNGARQTVFNYVNGLNLSVKEKRDILDKAGYTILKNGNIDW